MFLLVATPQQITYHTPHPDWSEESHGPNSEQQDLRARSDELDVSKAPNHQNLIMHSVRNE
jgi:hypothetical protein